VGVATLAEKIAEKTKKSSPHLAYTAGLLHDIGKVILDQLVADYAPLFFRDICRENQSFSDSEKKIIGITHSEAGALLARRWKFPDTLSEVIRNHHTPEACRSNQDLVYIIYLSDFLTEKFSTGFDLEKIQTKSLAKALNHLGLTMKNFPELVDALPTNIFNGNDPFNMNG
jgi:putative nucleotidyltransferase with HDIG domain